MCFLCKSFAISKGNGKAFSAAAVIAVYWTFWSVANMHGK